MKPFDYQVAMYKEALPILKKYGLVYLSAQERVGKTLTSILVAEACKDSVTKVLVLTKRKAVAGWEETLAAYQHNKEYTVTTYQMLAKQIVKPDLVIIDEAHAYLAAVPKASKTQQAVRKACLGLPIIFISATPHAQGHHQLFHQLQVSSFSPWAKFKTFYAWFRTYGIPKSIQVHGKTINQYTTTKADLCRQGVAHLFVTRTRAALDFPHEPNDKLHFVPLSEETKALYNALLKDKMLVVDPIERSFVADSSMKLRASLHMLEGGVLKWRFPCETPTQINQAIKQLPATVCNTVMTTETLDGVSMPSVYLMLDSLEKVEYIKRHWGDTKDLVIFYQYKAELFKLQDHFKKAQLLQGTSYAEGVELSHIDTCVVYSMDWSTARYVQRRARQAGFNRDKPIVVHYLLAEGAVSAQVYNTVAVNKKNFVDSMFEELPL